MTTFDLVMLALLGLILAGMAVHFIRMNLLGRNAWRGPARWWLVAIVAMVVINAALLLLFGPRGGFGLFLFLPFVFGGRHKNGVSQ